MLIRLVGWPKLVIFFFFFCLCRAIAAHARGLTEANEELVDQRIDLMVQLAHLKAFLSNADKHERKLRVGSCLDFVFSRGRPIVQGVIQWLPA